MTTAATTTPTPLQQAGTDLHAFLAGLGIDAVTSLQGILATFGTNIQKTPTETNLIAQALLVATTAPLALPSLESTGIGQAGNLVVQLTALLTPKPPAAS